MIESRDMVLGSLAALEAAGIEYAILHGHEDLPDNATSDIDVVVAPDTLNAVGAALRGWARTIGGDLVQSIRHESTACYYVVACPGPNGDPAFLKLDACTDYRRDGAVLFSATELLQGRRRIRDMWVASERVEYAHYLLKKLLKMSSDETSRERLQQLYRALSPVSSAELAGLVGNEVEPDVRRALESGDWSAIDQDPARIRGALKRHLIRRRPSASATYAFSEGWRRLSRIVRPTGLHVSILGPDGVGKSTVIRGVSKAIAPAFRRVSVAHLRPGLLPSSRATVGAMGDAPYARAPLGSVRSIAKLAYLWADYALGYVLRVLPLKVTSTLVVFDRYFLDVVADPVRYRYGGPAGLPQAATRLAPTPDMYVVLLAPTATVQRRKAEVTEEETSRQLRAYEALGSNDGVYVLDASADPVRVVRELSWAVLHRMAKRVSV